MSLAKVIKNMNQVEKRLKSDIQLSTDEQKSKLEKKLLDIADRVKKEGIQ